MENFDIWPACSLTVRKHGQNAYGRWEEDEWLDDGRRNTITHVVTTFGETLLDKPALVSLWNHRGLNPERLNGSRRLIALAKFGRDAISGQTLLLRVFETHESSTIELVVAPYAKIEDDAELPAILPGEASDRLVQLAHEILAGNGLMPFGER